MDPLQFLESLKIKYGKNRIVMLQPYTKDTGTSEELHGIGKVPQNWIRSDHIDKLIKLLDDTSLTVPVFSIYADLIPTTEPKTTIGIEAMRLIQGYKNQRYPSLWPEYYAKDTAKAEFKVSKTDLITWRENELQKK